MVCCLMIQVEHAQPTESVIDKVIQMINPDYFFKRNEWIVTYANHDNKLLVWQAALELELEGTVVGYGFGSTIDEAREDVYRVLWKRIGIDRSTYQTLLS